MSAFRDWQPTLHPTALRGRWGTAWAASLGAEKDTLLSLAKEAVTARFVDAAPSDALALHGHDRDLERSPIDTAATFRARIAASWDVWSRAGTPYGYAYALSLTSVQIRGARFVAQYQ